MRPLHTVPLVLATVAAATAAEPTYLDRLSPVVHLRLDQQPAASVTLANGCVLTKSAQFPDSFPALVAGPYAWAGKGWDFGKCDGPYLLKINEAMTRVGDIHNTAGMTVTFWFKGEYRGSTSRIMTGPFDIGTARDGIWGGSHDYQNAQSGKPNPWDMEWHHFAVVVDFKADIDHLKVYVDGKLRGRRSAVYLKSLAGRVGRTWCFGARNHTDKGHNFGPLADIAVFDRPLSLHEIAYINSGPVYAGPDQTHTMPNSLKLTGFAPVGQTASWQQLAGPGKAQITDPAAETTGVVFTTPGDYEFQLSSGGARSVVKIKVLPNQPPKVFAGEGMAVKGDARNVMLEGTVSDTSVPAGSEVTSKWSVVSAPEGATATFADAAEPGTSVALSARGLYTLRLTATDGETSAFSDVNVLVDGAKRVSYMRLLRPVFMMGFEEPARRTVAPMLDDTGSTGLKVRRPEHGAPRMIAGARPHTGYAWDFSPSDSDLEVINGEQFIDIFEQALPGRSMSFWIKGNDKTAGHICGIFAQTRIQRGYGLTSDFQGGPAIRFDKWKQLLDDHWHHIAIVITLADAQVTRVLYVDGKEGARVVSPIPSPWWVLGSPEIRHSKFIGSRGRSGAGDCYDGQLDDFALFDYALTPDDIAFIYNGPSDADRGLLKKAVGIEVDAGRNQYVQLPAAYQVKLRGTVKVADGMAVRWSKARGAGEVVFAQPESLATTATFTPVEDDKDGKYSKFVLRLSAVNAQGREIAGDDVVVLFYPDRAPKVRALTNTPAPGEHPRIFFTGDDLPELRRKALQFPVAKRAVAAMGKRVAGLDNPQDKDGSLYQSILNSRAFSIRPVYGGNGGGFYGLLAEAAYVNWLGEDGQSDTAKLTEVATVFSRACHETLTWYEPNHGNALCHDVNPMVGLCYDLLHDWMDKAGRRDARHLLSRMTSHRQSVGVVSERRTQRASTNWIGYHDHLIPTALAIEGEPGFDVGVIDVSERKDAQFLTQYGVFESGLPHEGYAYYTFGMTWMSAACYAISRRDNRENLMETTRFYHSIETAFRLLDKDGIRSHHDVVEDSKTGAGLVNLPPRHVMVAKYLWPEDRMVDYVWRTLSRNLLADEDRRFNIFHAAMGEAVRYPDQTLKEAAAQRPPTRFCPDRGFVMARDRWDENGLRLDFRCRMDKYWLGHVHSDVNSFELWSHDRPWIIDRGKFAGTVQEAQSCILIDGMGAFSAKRNAWPSSPGRFVEYADSDLAVTGVGDAKPFFEWSKAAPRSGPTELVNDHGLMWSDYYFPREGEVMPQWMNDSPMTLDGYGNVHGLYKMNPVKKAFRTATLVEGKHPFVVITDDYQKDDRPHDYLWSANVPFKESMVVVSKDETSLTLRHRTDGDGPFLLVRVLQARGLTGIDLNRAPYKVGKDTIPSVRIEIACKQVVAPDYRVLLYPYKQGDPMPAIAGDRITIGDQVRTVTFTPRRDGPTQVTVSK